MDGCFYQSNFAQANFIQPCFPQKSRALRQLARKQHHTPGLTTEARYREIALRKERQAHLALLNIARERIAELKREQDLLNVVEVRKPRRLITQPPRVIPKPLPNQVSAKQEYIIAQLAKEDETIMREVKKMMDEEIKLLLKVVMRNGSH